MFDNCFFYNSITEGDPQPTFGNVTRTHHLTFNLTSLVRGEDIYLAELRLFTLIEADRNSYLGVDRSVSLYHQDLETPQVSQLATSFQQSHEV